MYANIATSVCCVLEMLVFNPNLGIYVFKGIFHTLNVNCSVGKAQFSAPQPIIDFLPENVSTYFECSPISPTNSPQNQNQGGNLKQTIKYETS